MHIQSKLIMTKVYQNFIDVHDLKYSIYHQITSIKN